MKTSAEYYGRFNDPCPAPERAPDKERVNLVKGLVPAIRAHCAIEDRHCTEWFNQFPDNGLLTDGNYAERDFYDDPAFFHMTGGEMRDIIFDLGSLCAVDGFRIGILRHTRYGLFQPPRVKLFLSADGTGWQSAGSVTGFETWGKSKVIRPEYTLAYPIAARYAKFVFAVPFHIWIDEIELFGCTDASGAPEAVNDGGDSADIPGRFASTEQLGAKDVMLAYMCRTDIPPVSKEMLLPYVGYIENGVIKDTMFDSFLFLPHVWFLYKGNEKLPLKKTDWEFFINEEFKKGQCIEALDEAAEEVGNALGIKDFRLTVTLSILYPVTSVSEFGEVGGKNLDFSLTEDRISALKWLIDEQYKRFKAANYKHLDLIGFYWFTEEIDYNDGSLMELLKATTDHVRSLGLKTSWIPYYHASGYCDWRDIGFDIGCYQPNYAFDQSVADRRLFDAARTAKHTGMCIELEMGGTDDWHIERMKKYYAAGAITGYMKDAAHMYYQGSMPGYFYKAYESEDKKLHSIYKDTYDFIKGVFDPSGIGFDIEGECPFYRENGGNNNA